MFVCFHIEKNLQLWMKTEVTNVQRKNNYICHFWQRQQLNASQRYTPLQLQIIFCMRNTQLFYIYCTSHIADFDVNLILSQNAWRNPISQRWKISNLWKKPCSNVCSIEFVMMYETWWVEEQIVKHSMKYILPCYVVLLSIKGLGLSSIEMLLIYM